MAERSCCPAFPLPFDGLIVTRQIDFSDEVPDQFNLLPAVAAGLVRRMDADPFVSFPAPPYFGQRPEVTGQPLRLQGGACSIRVIYSRTMQARSRSGGCIFVNVPDASAIADFAQRKTHLFHREQAILLRLCREVFSAKSDAKFPKKRIAIHFVSLLNLSALFEIA